MATLKHTPGHHTGDGESSSGSESCCSESQSGISDVYSYSQDEDSSYFAGSVSSASDSCSVDSIGRMLIQLDENNPSLKELIIDCKSMDKEAATYVAQILPLNTCLQKLRLHCGKSTSHRQIFHKVVLGLNGNTSIASIEIQGADFDREAASWLVHLFSCGQALKHIRMINCNFLGSGLAILFVALQHNKCIRELAFCFCNWEDHNADVLSSSLPFMSLNSLSLVDIEVTADGLPYLLRNIEDCKELIHLDLSQNQLEESDIHLLSKSLTIQDTISKLSLSSCSLDDKCMKELANGLRNYSTLTSLDISQNSKISDKGVVYLKYLLKFNHSITELKVDDCGLNEQSTDAIESGLRYNNSFLKSFFSESTSQAILGVVDSIEQIDIGESTRHLLEAVSLDSESLPPKEEMDSTRISRPTLQPRPWIFDSMSGKMSPGGSFVEGKKGKVSRRTPEGKRKMLL